MVLCAKLLMTLNLAARLWYLSPNKYKSVYVGFLYTVVQRDLSGSDMTKSAGIEWTHQLHIQFSTLFHIFYYLLM